MLENLVNLQRDWGDCSNIRFGGIMIPCYYVKWEFGVFSLSSAVFFKVEIFVQHTPGFVEKKRRQLCRSDFLQVKL